MQDLKIDLVAYADFEAELRSIRFSVFVDEQGVPAELEMDGRDASAWHAIARLEGVFIGTGRLLPDGKIGRMAVLGPYRNRGFGEKLLQALLRKAWYERLPRVWLSAQLRAERFYQRFGFERRGGVYFEAGLEHVSMVLTAREDS